MIKDELSERQEKILTSLIEQYIGQSQPISSQLLKKECGLDVCPATIRNDLQDLTERGYITQPHTSAGRIPTERAYRYFTNKVFDDAQSNFPKFLFKEIERIQKKIQEELALVQELENYLTNISLSLNLSYNRLEEDNFFEILTIVSSSKNKHEKNISLIDELIRELENF